MLHVHAVLICTCKILCIATLEYAGLSLSSASLLCILTKHPEKQKICISDSACVEIWSANFVLLSTIHFQHWQREIGAFLKCIWPKTEAAKSWGATLFFTTKEYCMMLVPDFSWHLALLLMVYIMQRYYLIKYNLPCITNEQNCWNMTSLSSRAMLHPSSSHAKPAACHGREAVTHPPYSPDLSACDHILFPCEKATSGTLAQICRFHVSASLHHTSTDDYGNVIDSLPHSHQWEKCISTGGDYVVQGTDANISWHITYTDSVCLCHALITNRKLLKCPCNLNCTIQHPNSKWLSVKSLRPILHAKNISDRHTIADYVVISNIFWHPNI